MEKRDGTRELGVYYRYDELLNAIKTYLFHSNHFARCISIQIQVVLISTGGFNLYIDQERAVSFSTESEIHRLKTRTHTAPYFLLQEFIKASTQTLTSHFFSVCIKPPVIIFLCKIQLIRKCICGCLRNFSDLCDDTS